MTYHRKFLFGLLVLGLLAACTQTPQQQLSEKVKEKIKHATVHVQTDIVNNRGGSGFFVASDKIVTNIHVLAGKPEIFVSVVGPETTYHIEGVVGFDPEHDLVILQVKPEGTPLRLGRGKINDQIFAAGYPAVKQKVTKTNNSNLRRYKQEYKGDAAGTIHKIWNEGKQLKVVSNSEDSGLSPLTSGNSGGPVVNLKGEVVGIAVTGKKEDSKTPTLGGAASTLVLKELMDKSKSVEPMSLSNWGNKPCVRAYVSYTHGENKMAEAESKKEAAVQKRLYSEASEYFDKASKLCPNYAAAHFRLGKAKLFLSEFKAAIDAFAKVIELIPDHDKAHLYIGMAWYELGKETDGQNAEKHYEEAIHAFDITVSLNNENTTSYQNKNVAKLVSQLKAALYYLRATAKFHLGELKVKERNKEKAQSLYSEVLDDFTEGIELDPDSANIFRLVPENTYGYYIQGGVELILGQSKAKQQNVEEARQHYNKGFSNFSEATKLNPDDADVYYDKVINALKPDNADTYQMRGLMKFLRGQSKTNQGEAAGARLHYQGAIKDYQEAIKRYRKAVKQDSEYIVSAYSNLGYTKYLLGKSFESEGGQENMKHAQNLYEEAIVHSNEAIQQDPKHPNSYYTQGLARSALGNYKKAIEAFDNVIEFKDNYAKAYYDRGRAKQALEQHEAAKADFEKAKELDPNVGK